MFATKQQTDSRSNCPTVIGEEFEGEFIRKDLDKREYFDRRDDLKGGGGDLIFGFYQIDAGANITDRIRVGE